jgi:D-alanine-D-alanine ligase
VNLEDFSFSDGGAHIQFDYAYIIIHGTPGEDGRLQGYLEMKGIPYSTGPVLNMALTFNKAATQRLLKSNGLSVAKHMIITDESRPDAEEIASQLGLPCFVKPSESGSSLGVTKVKLSETMDAAIDHALEYSSEVIIESFLDGRELACGVLRTANGVQALPVTEIIAQSEFFDYKAKYEDESTREETPADISDDATLRCQELSRQIYKLTGCDGIARVDFFLCGEELFVVEINTVPGMSKESLVPKQLKAVGINLKEYITWKISGDIAKKESK